MRSASDALRPPVIAFLQTEPGNGGKTRSKGATHKWDLRTLAQPNKFGGYYPQIVPGENRVANFWEQTDRATKSNW